MSARRSRAALARVLAMATMLDAGCDGDATAAVTIARAPAPSGEVVAAVPFGEQTLTLRRDAEGIGVLWLSADHEPARLVPCDRLVGAWGLWIDDVDRDGFPEAIVALQKRARFDDTLANRLHVYGFDDGRCVPAWRGTRLAGRFDALATDPQRPGTIVVSERVGERRRRLARYRWTGFGYAVAAVLWEGEGAIPLHLTRDLVVAPS